MASPVQRLLLVAEWYPSDDDPVAGAFIEEQAVALARHFAIGVISPRLRRWRDRTRVRSGVRVEQRRGIPIARVEAAPAVPYLRRSLYASHGQAVERAYDILLELLGAQPDLIHAHVVRYSGWSAVRLGRRTGIPVVLTEHSGPFGVHVANPADRRRVVETLAACDAVLAVSPYLREQMAPFSKREIEVVGNVIDTDFFSPLPSPANPQPASSGPLRVLAVGLLTREKRFDIVIDAVATLARRRPAVELTIVGDGPERSVLEHRVQERSITSMVRFAGVADRNGVRDAMRRADVLIVASDAETFGVVAAEAMACGTPVIATRSGGPEYIVEPGTGVLVPRGDPGAIADALERLCADWSSVDRDAARVSIERRFGRSAFLNRLGAVYSRVVAS